jgi:hypothetical protein
MYIIPQNLFSGYVDGNDLFARYWVAGGCYLRTLGLLAEQVSNRRLHGLTPCAAIGGVEEPALFQPGSMTAVC